MNTLLISCALFVLINYAHATYSDCGSEEGTVTTINVTGCNNEVSRCTLHRDTNATIQIEFVPKNPVTSLKAVVHGVIMGVDIPFALPNSDGCKDSGLTCPLSAGETYTYYTTLPVLKKYPRVTVDVKFELQNADSKDVACVLIPSKIQ